MAELPEPAEQPPEVAPSEVTTRPGQPSSIGSYSVRQTLSQLRLRELLAEVRDRVDQVIDMRDRIDALVEAMLAINSILDLDDTLRTVVRASTALVDAEYGALAVYGHDRRLHRFICQDSDGVAREHNGTPPERLGALGVFPDPVRRVGPDERPARFAPSRSFLTVPVRIRDETFGILYLADRSDQLPFGEDDKVIAEALAAAAGIAIDNARLFESARTRQAWIAATRDITTELLAGTPSGEVLAHLTDTARTLTHSLRAFLAVAPDPDSALEDITELVVSEWSGPGPGLRPDSPLSTEGTTIGAAFLGRTAAALDAAPADLADLLPDAGPALIVPLLTSGSTLGVLAVLREAGAAPYTAEIVELATTFTDQVALAMRLAQAQQRMRVVDILTDRDRIAHDLHDHVIQQLFAIGLSLQATIPRTQSTEVRDLLTGIANGLQDVVQEIRTSIFELHGGDQQSTQLRERLEMTIRREGAYGELRTALRVNGPLSVVGGELAEHVEAVVREAVRNAARQSGATGIDVEIGVADDLTVIVTDDGGGPEPGGLDGLRRRAEQSGGRFEVRASTAPSAGTRVYWSVPLR
ncbi:GAF domain-containing protein [Nocardia sp. NEAU-G5]|uniref:GAF domain-containing protein n=1 Tax=Nocardia albiluteola TaxID=2842303 RepID=A0ABS6B2J5_9NOCA|nr:GAF domain-containing protein [Nocardia albiluteola]MBU3064507.1 GAF domain-containing protein [Nocardia albiluteola]